jgi:hypothetical protein
LLLLGSPDRQASIGNQEFTALALVVQTEFRTVSYQLHFLCSPRAIIANVEARAVIRLRPERRQSSARFASLGVHGRNGFDRPHTTLLCIVRHVKPQYVPAGLITLYHS